jgi:hypothetical protein
MDPDASQTPGCRTPGAAMAVCARCGAEIPPGFVRYEGDDGSALCGRCFRGSRGDEPRPRGFALLRGLAVAFRICAVAGLAGGAAIAHLGREGEWFIPAAGIALGAGVCFGCLALAELIRLGLSVEASLGRLSCAVERIEGVLYEGGDAGGRRG